MTGLSQGYIQVIQYHLNTTGLSQGYIQVIQNHLNMTGLSQGGAMQLRHGIIHMVFRGVERRKMLGPVNMKLLAIFFTNHYF